MTTIDKITYWVLISALAVAVVFLACAVLFAVGVTFWAYIW